LLEKLYTFFNKKQLVFSLFPVFTINIYKNNNLKKLNHFYPYHQTIGFYIESTGFIEESSIFSKAFPIQFNFYLTYHIDETDYSEKWRIFYPKDLLKNRTNIYQDRPAA